MILRLWRGRLRPDAGPTLLRRLREEVVPELRAIDGLSDFVYGFRHDGDATWFLAASTWRDFQVILEQTAGDPSRSLVRKTLDDLFTDISAETFEELEPGSVTTELRDGRVLGVVVASIRPNEEPVVQAMVERSVQAALDAGARAAHVGRRIDRAEAQLVVLVVWPDRSTLAAFVRARPVGAIDPAFTAHLTSWRFETYDAIGPERLLVPAAGPAVLVADGEGRYVDASPGIERVVGMPAEFLLGRRLSELVADVPSGEQLWSRFVSEGQQEGVIDLRALDGRTVNVRYRAATNCPVTGLHASVLSLPDEDPDPRPVPEIVADALGRPGTRRSETA